MIEGREEGRIGRKEGGKEGREVEIVISKITTTILFS